MDAGIKSGIKLVIGYLLGTFFIELRFERLKLSKDIFFLPLPLMSNRIPQHEEKRVVFIPSPQKLPVGGSDPEGRFQCTIWRLLHPQSYIK